MVLISLTDMSSDIPASIECFLHSYMVIISTMINAVVNCNYAFDTDTFWSSLLVHEKCTGWDKFLVLLTISHFSLAVTKPHALL